MRLDNQTPFQAELVSIRLPNRSEHNGMLIAKATYEVAPDFTTALAKSPVPIMTEQLPTSFGIYHGDVHPPHSGVDLCVLGTLERSRPFYELEVGIFAPNFSSRLVVTGDRTWQDRGDQLVGSAAAPFVQMPISYERAFGGCATIDGDTAPYPENPVGRGYYLSKAEAMGKPLANLRWAETPAPRSWNEPLEVAGWGPYPYYWALRAARAVEYRGERLKAVDCSLFNNAHPRLILPELAPGHEVLIDGLRDTRLRYRLPGDILKLRVRVGDTEFFPEMRIDRASIWVDAGKIVLNHRALFSYAVQPRQVRRAELTLEHSLEGWSHAS